MHINKVCVCHGETHRRPELRPGSRYALCPSMQWFADQGIAKDFMLGMPEGSAPDLTNLI